MGFCITGYQSRFILYGKTMEIKCHYDETSDCGLQPLFMIDMEVDAPYVYHGILVYPADSGYLRNLDYPDPVLVVFTGQRHLFSEAVNNLEEHNPFLANQTVYYYEFYSALIKHLSWLDKPPHTDVKKDVPHVLLALQLGFVMGGVEAWVAQIYHKLRAAGSQHVAILEPLHNGTIYTYVGGDFYGIPKKDILCLGPYNGFLDYTMKAIEILVERRPTLLVDNGSYEVMAAAYFAKKHYNIPDKVIMILHSDANIVYTRLRFFHEIVDMFIAVSDAIYQKAIQIVPERATDFKVRMNCPTPHHESLLRKSKGGKLQIAYGARLENENKRSLWLIDVMRALNERGLYCDLHIAGDGECLELLCSYATDNEYSFVHIYGQIEHNKMDDFWADKDVFINFSIREGMPLAVLESMSHGLVPVMTDAGFASSIIHENKNGFIISSPQEAVEKIEWLINHQERRIEMGKESLYTLDELYKRYGDLIEDFT